MSLAEIQRTIAGTLMRPLTSAELMRPDAAETANRIVKPNDRLTAFERLQIYNQQYWWRLLGSFQDDFRGLRAVLGERKFDRLAVAYLDACGSTSWNLRDLGQALEPFLGQHPELVAPHGTLALEMVRVEWARVIAFDGPEKPPLDPTKLGLAPELLRFELQPYVTLLELTYPVDKLLGRLRKSNTGIASNAVSASRRRGPVRLSASPAPRPIHIAVHRVDLAVYYKRLDAEAYRLLCALRSGATLADACGAAFADSRDLPEQAAAKIREWFATWMGFGWLVRR
ncbi:MAG: hypothetical protein QOE70_6382 [Chthoniobacter sp.]|nr:hypothetical protein [Chthoniobacter sp.]